MEAEFGDLSPWDINSGLGEHREATSLQGAPRMGERGNRGRSDVHLGQWASKRVRKKMLEESVTDNGQAAIWHWALSVKQEFYKQRKGHSRWW